MIQSNFPEIQIEQIDVLTKSHVSTIKNQGYTISNIKLDISSGKEYVIVYNVGKIVKQIFFSKNDSNLK